MGKEPNWKLHWLSCFPKAAFFPPYLLPQVFKVCEHERLSWSDAHMSENRDGVSHAL